MTDIIIKKDWEGYLAEVIGNDQLFAYGATEEDAKKELLGVVEMTMDYHLELVESERNIKNQLTSKEFNYAI